MLFTLRVLMVAVHMHTSSDAAFIAVKKLIFTSIKCFIYAPCYCTANIIKAIPGRGASNISDQVAVVAASQTVYYSSRCLTGSGKMLLRIGMGYDRVDSAFQSGLGL